MAITTALKSGLATIGYNLKLPGMGITQPAGTPYNANQTPYKVYNQTQGYTYAPNSGAKNVASSPAPGWYDYGTKNNTSPTGGSYGAGGGGQVLGGQAPDFSGGIISPTQNLGGGGSEIDVINDQFNQFNGYLNQQEGTARANFDETKGLYDESKASAEKQYKGEQVAQTEGLKKSESLNLGKVRQLLSDLSQRQAAQIGITGGGSVSEALGERFGRTAQQGLGNVMDQTQSAIQRVGDFYNNAVTKLGESYQQSITQARQVLNENLGQISLARTQSAAAKQNATMDAWRSFYGQVNQAKVEAAKFKAQYDLWKSQQDNQLAATSGFNMENHGQYNQGVAPSLNGITSPGVKNTNQGQQAYNPYYNQFAKDDQKDQVPQYGTGAMA